MHVKLFLVMRAEILLLGRRGETRPDTIATLYEGTVRRAQRCELCLVAYCANDVTYVCVCIFHHLAVVLASRYAQRRLATLQR